MNKGLFTLTVAATALSAHAQTVVDNFTTANTEFDLTATNSYANNSVTIPGPIFSTENASANGSLGSGPGSLTVSVPGTGTLTAATTGTATGALDLQYTSSGPVDVSAYQSFTLSVQSVSAPLTGYFEAYSNGYNNYTHKAFSISGSGNTTISLSGLSGSPFDATSVNTIYFTIGLGTNQSLVLSKITANATPEPATYAVMGVGVLGLMVRRKRTHLNR